MPSSQVSSTSLVTPSPQNSVAHVAEQPSSETVFPSSHSSSTSFVTPSPQYSSWQVEEQPSPDASFPSSQSSSGVGSPSPQKGSSTMYVSKPASSVVSGGLSDPSTRRPKSSPRAYAGPSIQA